MFKAGAGSAGAYLRQEFKGKQLEGKQRSRAIILRFGGCGSSRADPSRSTDAGDLVASLLNFLGLAMFSQNDSREDTSRAVPVAWRRGMETNLKAKAEKYETKAAQCEEWAREATAGPERSLYGELADYYGKLATDFRRVIARRSLT